VRDHTYPRKYVDTLPEDERAGADEREHNTIRMWPGRPPAQQPVHDTSTPQTIHGVKHIVIESLPNIQTREQITIFDANRQIMHTVVGPKTGNIFDQAVGMTLNVKLNVVRSRRNGALVINIEFEQPVTVTIYRNETVTVSSGRIGVGRQRV